MGDGVSVGEEFVFLVAFYPYLYIIASGAEWLKWVFAVREARDVQKKKWKKAVTMSKKDKI